MLKGKQTNHSVCGGAYHCLFTHDIFHHDNNIHNLYKTHQMLACDAWHTVYDPLGNVYYAACDRAHCKWLQAAVMPGESVKRSQAKQLAWLEGGHAVTRKHVLKMHKAPGTSRVFETHRLSLHKGSKDIGCIPLRGALQVDCCECMWNSSNVCIVLYMLDVIIVWLIKERMAAVCMKL